MVPWIIVLALLFYVRKVEQKRAWWQAQAFYANTEWLKTIEEWMTTTEKFGECVASFQAFINAVKQDRQDRVNRALDSHRSLRDWTTLN